MTINEYARQYASARSRGELREKNLIYEAVMYGFSLRGADVGEEEVQAQPIPEHVEIPGQAGKPYTIATEQPSIQGSKSPTGGIGEPLADAAPPKQMKWDVPADTTLPNSGEGNQKPSAIESTEPGEENADAPVVKNTETKPVEQANEQAKEDGPVVEGIGGDEKPIVAPSQEEAVNDVEDKRDSKIKGKSKKD